MTTLLPVYPRLPIRLERAEGSTLYVEGGRQIVDLYGGHACCPVGHAHPALVEAIRTYERLDFFSNSVLMDAQEEAAEALVRGSEHLSHVHFVNSGAEANESAIHLARTFTGKTKVLSFDVGFHGRTQGALAATGLKGYRDRLRVPRDPEQNDFIAYGSTEDLRKIDRDTAAVLCESVPSLAGVLPPPPGYYEALERRCCEVGALLIFDEVQGGVGRLGTWFGHETFGVRPAMVTLAKSLGGGYPVGALVVAEFLADFVSPSELGTTFGGGPTACAMVQTVARLVREDGLQERTTQIHCRLRDALGDRVRGAGCLIGVRTVRPAKEVQSELLERDLMVGSSGDPQAIRLLPSYNLEFDRLDRFAEALLEIDHA